MSLSFRHVRTFVFAAATALIAVPFVAVVNPAPTGAQSPYFVSYLPSMSFLARRVHPVS